jgi:hypothetical protein
MQRSFSNPATQAEPAFVGRPPVGEEGAAYARVRRYLWPQVDPPVAPEGAPPAAPAPLGPRP